MTAVSVIVPAHGAWPQVTRLVAQLRDQHGLDALDVVVVDDASPEEPPRSLRADIIRRRTNGGFGAAVNSGLAGVRSPLTLIMNSDVEIGPRFVADLVAAAAPWQPVVAGPAVFDGNGRPTSTARRFPRPRHQIVEWLVPLARWRHTSVVRRAIGHDTRCGPGEVRPVDWLVGAALLVPTESLRAVGGFDERFFMNCEEVDLQRRLRSIGVGSVYLGTVSCTHYGGGSSEEGSRRRWLVEARFEYARKWGGHRRLRAGLAAATATNFAWNLARRATGRAVAPCQVARSEWALATGGP